MNTTEVREIYANAPTEKSMMEVISFDAPWFSQKYYLQNQFPEGIGVITEDSVAVIATYAPVSMEQASSNADLNYERKISIQHLNSIIANENDNRDDVTHEGMTPEFQSRGYIVYQDGTVSSVQYGPVTLPVRDIQSSNEGAVINVSSLPTNDSPTGEIATVTRVPMLRGFV